MLMSPTMDVHQAAAATARIEAPKLKPDAPGSGGGNNLLWIAAGVVVHAAYNLTLFAGMLLQTGGFRHLERMTN